MKGWMKKPLFRRTLILGFCLFFMTAAGCGRAIKFRAAVSGERDAAGLSGPPRGLPMFSGDTGAAIGWPDLMEAAQWAEVIIIGEEHDDAVGHMVELAIVEDVLDRWLGAALSLEMFERDEQELVDDYLAGRICAAGLVQSTDSARWGGKDKWMEWYQPMLDAARVRAVSVVAANAPGKYTSLARKEGFKALLRLKRSERKLFAFPLPIDQDD